MVSGDLTQRARSHQFVEAKHFLDRLTYPQVVVPGNHDVPLYNVLDRFVNPLEKFKKYITADLTLPPKALNLALERTFAAERHLIGRVPLPPGLSLFAVASAR